MIGDETSPKGSPSNDRVVDDLLKEFNDGCTVEASEKEETPDETESGSSKTVDVDQLVEETKPVKREDYVDEEELKQKELSYTEEDKQRLKAEAEELKQKGNSQFKNSEFKECVESYTLGLRTCPLAYQKERAILYANRAAAKVKLGEEEAAVEDCSKAIELDPQYIRAVLRRAQLYETTDRLDEALEDYKKLLELDPSNKDAAIACQRLPPLIHERNEKMKTEMLGKLKDLGNVLLRPFGLSTENFKMVQDPNTGGYSVNFQQNS